MLHTYKPKYTPTKPQTHPTAASIPWKVRKVWDERGTRSAFRLAGDFFSPRGKPRWRRKERGNYRKSGVVAPRVEVTGRRGRPRVFTGAFLRLRFPLANRGPVFSLFHYSQRDELCVCVCVCRPLSPLLVTFFTSLAIYSRKVHPPNFSIPTCSRLGLLLGFSNPPRQIPRRVHLFLFLY